MKNIVLLLIFLLVSNINCDLLATKLASGTDASDQLVIDSQETILVSASAGNGLKIFSITGSNTWTTSGPGDLSTLTVATYTCGNQATISPDDKFLFVACGTGGLKVFDIQGKNSWSTGSPTDLSTVLIGSYTGTVNSVIVSSSGYFVFIGTSTTIESYDIRTIGSWSNQDISTLPKFGSTTSNAITDTKSIQLLENENFALVAGAGAFVINIAGQSTFLNNSITINFAIVGSYSGTAFTGAIASPDFSYAWLGLTGQGVIISLSGYQTWSSQDMSTVVVAKLVDASITDGAVWINGPNYLVVSKMNIYDFRSRESLAPTTFSLATDIYANSLYSWSLNQAYYFVQNPGLTRLYVSYGASGIYVLSLLSSDGWSITVCQIGTYYMGSTCYSCLRSCGTCYDQFDCSSCAGDENQAYSRLLSLNCECPSSGYLDNIWNNIVDTSCTAGSSCGANLVKVNSRCINEDCLVVGQEFVTTDVTLTVSQVTVESEVNYNFVFDYVGTFATASITTWPECYTSNILIEEVVGNSTIEHYIPISISGLTVTGTVRMVDLVTSGCSYVEDTDNFTYTCNTKWINKFFDQNQQVVSSTITIKISRSTNTTLNITVGQTNTTTGCIGCDTNYQVSSEVQLIDQSGNNITNNTFLVGDSVRMRVQIQDEGLRSLYYLKHLSTVMQTSGFNLTLVPTERDSSSKGIVIIGFTASLSATSASIIVSCTLQTTLPTYTLMRRNRMLQTQSQSLVASLQLNIVDPNQISDNQTKTVKEDLTVVIFVSVGGMLSFMMIAYHLYEGYCRDSLSKVKKTSNPNKNFSNLYSKYSNLTNNTQPDDQNQPHFKLNNLKVEEIQ